MSAPREPPLDEVQWRSPAIAQSMGGIHTNSVLHYFSHSPFFDVTSNNATLTTQATYNASMFHLIQTREAFENRLRTMQGLEFMVVHEPSQLPAKEGVNANAPAEQDSGIWVIRKQLRRKVAGAEDELTVLSCYFVVGENIYMSPSVANVLGSRLLSTVTCLTKYLSTASKLPLFSPALGNVYIRPTPKPPTALAVSTQLRAGSSKESTPAPEGSQHGGVSSASAHVTSTSDSFQDDRLFAESFAMTLRHENDYMDDNPLVGEPGSFILSSTRGTAQPNNPAHQKVASTSKPAAREATTSPAVEDTSAVTAKKVNKDGDKSPTNPSLPARAKRRKSKASPISPGGITPT